MSDKSTFILKSKGFQKIRQTSRKITTLINNKNRQPSSFVVVFLAKSKGDTLVNSLSKIYYRLLDGWAFSFASFQCIIRCIRLPVKTVFWILETYYMLSMIKALTDYAFTTPIPAQARHGIADKAPRIFRQCNADIDRTWIVQKEESSARTSDPSRCHLKNKTEKCSV